MKHLKWGILAVLFLFVILLFSLVGNTSTADSQQAGSDDSQQSGRCKQIRAIIVDSSAPAGCTSPFNFCAAGTVEGNHGLNGTTYFVLDGAVAGPSTAPGFSATSGILTYTTPHGTLTVRETGVSKLVGRPSNGFLTAVQEIISGTGRFEGATGLLYLDGKDVNSVFTSHITGELCLPGPHE